MFRCRKYSATPISRGKNRPKEKPRNGVDGISGAGGPAGRWLHPGGRGRARALPAAPAGAAHDRGRENRAASVAGKGPAGVVPQLRRHSGGGRPVSAARAADRCAIGAFHAGGIAVLCERPGALRRWPRRAVADRSVRDRQAQVRGWQERGAVLSGVPGEAVYLVARIVRLKPDERRGARPPARARRGQAARDAAARPRRDRPLPRRGAGVAGADECGVAEGGGVAGLGKACKQSKVLDQLMTGFEL